MYYRERNVYRCIYIVAELLSGIKHKLYLSAVVYKYHPPAFLEKRLQIPVRCDVSYFFSDIHFIVFCNVYGYHLVLILVYGIASLKRRYDGHLMLNAFSSEKYTYSDFHGLILSLCQLSIICACL